MTKMAEKFSTDQRFIRERNTTYKIHTLTKSLFIYRYGGPGHQKVSQRWSFDWDHYLAGNRDFLVATLDVRGSGYSGDSFKHAVYKELGTYETQDTLKVIK